MSDPLERFSRALRDSTVAPGAKDAEKTLEKIERTLRARRVSATRSKRYLVLPFAAVFVVMAAWASASGRLAEIFSRRPEESSLPAPPESPNADAGPKPNAEPSPIADPSPDAEAPVAKPVIVRVDPDALYRAAHDEQFSNHDYGKAIAGWDRYLAAAGPGGRFVVEARYNRGIALVRLGRTPEARRALEPFASGDYGGYRREDAQKLLDSLK